jgi:ribonuclease E
MSRVMLINAAQPEESRIAVLDNGMLEEFYVHRSSKEGYLNNVYKGIITNIEPSIQAAFIDFGVGKNGFLHVSDIMPIYALRNPTTATRASVNANPANSNRRSDRRIEDMVRKGQEVLVQVTKDGIGNKGPSLTTYISLPGRFVVLMPSVRRSGVSHKIQDEAERKKLRSILRELSPPEGMGYIIRTAGADRTKKDLAQDLQYLLKLWKAVVKRTKEVSAPCPIYQESDLIIRTIRDIFTPEIEEIIVDTEEHYKKARDFMNIIAPRYENRIRIFKDPVPIFERYKMEQEIEKTFQKKIQLSSGGNIVIEPTEALVAIDVNSAKFTEESDLEETAFKTNMEALHEVIRQLKLRDAGGVIIIDFIDMKEENHRKEIERTLKNLLKKDRSRTKIAKMSPFGMIELTRQRVGPSLQKYHYQDCPHCTGTGIIKNTETMTLMTIRKLRVALQDPKAHKVEVRINPRISNILLNEKRRVLVELENEFKKEIVVHGDPSLDHEFLEIVNVSDVERPVFYRHQQIRS